MLIGRAFPESDWMGEGEAQVDGVRRRGLVGRGRSLGAWPGRASPS